MEKKPPIHIKATGYRMLVKVRDVELETASGIILAVDKNLEQAAEIRATVVSMGPDCYYDQPTVWCKEGDDILIAQYSGRRVIDPVTEEVYTLINDKDVVCVLDLPEEGEDNE